MPPAVVTGDLIASRAYGSAAAVNVLARVLHELNERYHTRLLAPFEAFQGDAFQGVLKRAADAPALIFHIQGLLIVASRGPKPLAARFGLGVGAIDQLESLATAPRDPALLTGPAFVAAAEALAQARKERRQLVLKSVRGALDNAANGTFGLIEYVWNRWSPEVWRRALRYDELEDVGKLADELGVSYQAVHKQLHARGILAVREALFGLGKLLEEAV